MDRKSFIGERHKTLRGLVKVAEQIGENYQQDSTMSDDELRLWSNNSRIGVKADRRHGYGISCYLGRSNSFFYAYTEIAYILQSFADKGDPLCSRLLEMDTEINDHIFLMSGIHHKLLHRTMSEEEYFGYLNGQKPLYEMNGKEYFLKKKSEKRVSV